MPTRTRKSPSIAAGLIAGCLASLLATSPLSTFGGALASERPDAIVVHRAACSAAIERCPHRYRESDFAELGVPFSKNLAGTETVLHIVPMLRIARLVVYPKDRLHFDRDGELVGMTARYDRDLLGSLDVAHSVPFHLHPNGMPESVTLRWKSSYRGKDYPTGARLTLDDEGAVLSSTSGDGEGPAIWAANAPLDSEITSMPASLDGIRIPQGTLIVVGGQGRRMEATFTQEFLFRGTAFAPGTVTFEPDIDGAPRFTGGTLARDQRVQGIELRATGSRTPFHLNGLLAGGILDGDQDVEGWPLRDGSAFERHPEGPLRRGLLSRSLQRNTAMLAPLTEIHVGHDGLLDRTFGRAQTVRVGNTVWEAHFLSFRADGSVASGTLAEAARIDGTPYVGGTLLRFTLDNRVSHAVSPPPVEEPIVAYVGTEKVELMSPEECAEQAAILVSGGFSFMTIPGCDR